MRVQRRCKRVGPVPAGRRDTRSTTLISAAMDELADDRPVLVLNPPDDPGFRALAVGLMDDGVRVPGDLEDRLRERHPHAVVRPRDLAGEQMSVWYVYRDGRWIGSKG